MNRQLNDQFSILKALLREHEILERDNPVSAAYESDRLEEPEQGRQ